MGDLSDEDDGGSFSASYGGEFSPEQRLKHLTEKIVSDAHVNEDMNGHLRCVLSVRKPNTEHFFFFEK